MIDCYELQEFSKDLKKLAKKYRSLPEDIETVKKVLKAKPDARPDFSFEINNLGIDACVIKVKKIACKSLKGKGVKSGLRVIYAYLEEDKKIILIEVFHKSDKANEDRDRIINYFKKSIDT